MLYQEAMEYLQNLTKFGMNFGLGRITELLRRLNNPHRHVKVIHVGGTNGKGSTTAMIARVLQGAGCRVGTFTSPHLHSFTERYRINNEEIKPERVARLVSVLRPHLESMVEEGFEHPTEFEVGTAMAFCYFTEEKVDYLVLEVGLGGAIDSTNVVTPILSIITNVAMDHMDYLGYTISEIASVKAGIIKPGVPVVTASDKPEALEIIEAVCREKGCRLVRVGRDVSWSRGGHSLQGQYFDYRGIAWEMKELWIPFMGKHQVINAVTAVASLEILQQQGVNIGEDALREGLAATIWPARLELIGNNPPVLVDAAHNYDGARCLRQALDEYFPDQRIIMVLGMLGDKERSKVVAELAPRASRIIITKPNSPRAGDWMQMAEEARHYLNKVDTIENIEQAVLSAISQAGKGDMVCVTGSFYMVAEAREVVIKEFSR
ncbi:bifunctional folylpolyglutamate synthase/dihydrofolate synthase [Desulfotruncus alcoholivorax]|uniref:bifunctional folylpolyglutamate synthase/dihydrofolate synthase n=1 Tax=Desulfotruncus alcoholivorax TaxID=265477 RepID=UPI000404CC82|nr:folylpolyglutamate synthase/dihydrofolate synthase family protein [Desulfotruncus alcoholivorax]